MRHYHPAWFAPGPHLKTLWGRLTGRRLALPARMERLTTPDDDEVELRRVDAPGAPAGAPRLLLLHGLEGGLHSHYVANFAAEALAHGWGMDLLIFRGCNGELNRQPRFYHSGETSDLDFVLGRLLEREPDVPRVLAGVSLGGNVLLKWLGEQGSGVPAQVKGAAAVSVPYDLARGCRYISQGFSRVYERHFLKSLKEKALGKLDRFPGAFDRDAVLRARTLWEFDDAVTAPLHGFGDAADYYRRSSSIGYLRDIRLPTLLLSAEDDPFLPREVLDEVRVIARDNPALALEFVARGGHVGFVSGALPWRSRYWGEWRTMQFLSERL